MIKKVFYSLLAFMVLSGIFLNFLSNRASAAFDPSRIMDAGIFDNSSSMNAAQIDACLNNNFPSSCISTNKGFQTQDVTGYSPSTGFTYGANVSAGTAIEHAAKAYDINPQVLLVTLQKEQSLVTGTGSRCVSTDANQRAKAYAAAMGYNCPDTITPNDYTGVNLYTINGVTVTSVIGTCVEKASTVGFSRQLINAAWKLKFNEQRSVGNTSWNVQKPGWDNSDDPPMNYPGPMTQGNRARYSGGPVVYYDGYTTIDGVSTYIGTGPTASFYHYTPHFAGNQNLVSIFETWFGSTQVPNYAWQLISQYAYTDSSMTTPADLTKLVLGQRVYIGFKAKNTGNITWINTGSNPARAGASSPQDRISSFCDSTWLSCSRPVNMQEASVAPGATATFEFWYKPSKTGTFNEYFKPLVEGVSWTNDIGMYFHTVVSPPIYSWSLLDQFAYTDSTKTTPVNLTKLDPGQRVFVGFEVKNTGNVNWPQNGNNAVRAGTTNPKDRHSAFCDPSWLGCNRPAVVNTNNLAPGQTSIVEFWYQAPSTTGSYKEYFSMVTEGVAWMNDPGLHYSTMVRFPTSGGSILSANQSLSAGQEITSADRRYRLIMQDDGNLVLYSINRPLWYSNTAGKPIVRAIMQDDGNFVLYDAQNKPYWHTSTAGRGSSKLIMQDDGNLVLYDNSNNPTWFTRTNGQL